MTLCEKHGRQVSVHVSRDVAWALHSREPIACAVVMFVADKRSIMSCVVSEDVIRESKLVSGPIEDTATFNANSEWFQQLVPICCQCFQERFGIPPVPDPSATNGTGYSLLIQPFTALPGSN
jgi:hypothetical protein